MEGKKGHKSGDNITDAAVLLSEELRKCMLQHNELIERMMG